MQGQVSGEAAADAALVGRTIRGDGRAFEALAQRYYRPVGGFILKRVGQHDVVEDLVQETFLEAFRGLKAGRTPEHFSSWLFGIAHNRCGKWLRRRRPLPFAAGQTEEIAAPAGPPGLEEIEEQQALLCRLEVGLAELPQETRQLLALKHREGRTCEQIAAEVGRPVGTVKSLLSRAYKALRQRLAPASEEPR
jgi:RNA polymerase sigma-70 factor (ECF subfamily)